MQREPCAEQWESRRKAVPDVTKTTLFYRKYASAEAEKLAREVDGEARQLPSGDKTICKVFKGSGDEWLLDSVGDGEVYVRLEPDTKHELEKGLCLRFGSASVVVIDDIGPDEIDGSSWLSSSC